MSDNLVENEIDLAPPFVNKRFYTFRVQPQDVDFQYNITLASLTNILLTTAGLNADENEFGIRNLNEINCTWVLLRLSVEMNTFPKQYEEINIETWVESVGRASTVRNFKIRNHRNEIIGVATSIWAMINIKSRRAQDLNLLNGIAEKATGEKLNMHSPEKLLSIENGQVDSFKVKYSHIDINGHVNSMRYVEWISDAVDLEIYKNMKIKRFDINFLNEIYYGEEIRIFAIHTNGFDFNFEIKTESKSSCRARILFSR